LKAFLAERNEGVVTIIMALLSFADAIPSEVRNTSVSVCAITHATREADNWPAPGSEDTKFGVKLEPEVCHGQTEVYARVQACGCAPDQGSSRIHVQASQDLNVHTSQLRDWMKKLSYDPQHAFPGHGQMKPGQLEITRLKREVTKLKAERDILKNCHGPMPAWAR
jgi:transposase